MKNVLIFGATGRAGSQIVAECLAAGHRVTAFTRRPAFPLAHPALTVRVGEITNAAAVAAALPGHDVVVSAVGNMNFDDPTPVVAPLLHTLVPHVATGQRLIVVSGSGLALHDRTTLRRDLPDQPASLRYPRADHWEA